MMFLISYFKRTVFINIMLQYNWDTTTFAAFLILIVSFGFLVIVNFIYWIFMRNRVVLAYRILALILINEFLVVTAELLPFINKAA